MAAPSPTTDLNVPDDAAAHAADAAPSLSSVHNHPPYAEMITCAIASLNERNGSGKRAIAKYIESHHSNLPPNHSSLLTDHLKRLKDEGQILMVKLSYKLPGSALAAPVSANGAFSVERKRRPGRPPKNKSVVAAVPVFAEVSLPENPVPNIAPQLQNVASGPVGGPAVGGTPRGRGRPPKQGGAKRSRGRPAMGGGVQTVIGRSRGRPRKNAAAPVMDGIGRSRGRPPKDHGPARKVANVEGGMADVDGEIVGSVAVGVGTGGTLTAAGGGLAQVAGKRRGRPPKAGSDVKRPRKVADAEPKNPRKLSGKPLGRPKKTASKADSQTPVNLQEIVSLDLKGKLQYFQSRIKHTVSIIKPLLNSETASTALQELETLAAMDVNTPLNIQPQS